eukprot:Seg2338.1 transcript_id=Seg2338.1/GoldUCD/mRNA.D3Y31 product="Dolichyldiphosphatase 1" protein_id=Seg2338.1/GoldUCD/D3Y31
MSDDGKRFCLNPPENEGIWKIFYQAAENIEWRAIALTHVEYPAGDIIGKGLAWMSLVPIFLIVSFVTLIIFRRELHTITFFIGILLNEIANQILKYSFKGPRPCRKGDVHHVVYGMPSSHSQFMAFFASYMVLFALIRLHNQYESKMDIVLKYVVSFGSLMVALTVAYSRIYLRYHTVHQVFYGLLVGFVLGICWFMFTQRILSPLFDEIVSWPISEFLLIRDSSRIPNVLWFEYVESRKEARQRQRKLLKPN